MDPPDKGFSEFVEIVKSWVPRRSEPLNLSRDFWMPDQSCRVCYECDSQFTVFNRRHHCRLCGRVFCAKCTSNSIPISPDDAKNMGEVGERIRVCNYCFKRWKQDLATTDNGIKELTTPVLSPSLSTTSLVSSKSSGTGNGSTTSAGSISISTGTHRHVSYGSVASNPSQPIHIGAVSDKQDMPITKMDSVDLGDTSPNQFEFCMHRSDDEDEYGGVHFDSETQHFQTSNEYYGPVYFEEFDQGYPTDKVFPSDENTDVAQNFSAVWNSPEIHTSSNDIKIGNGTGNDNNYECDASSTVYGMESLDMEPFDFENNKQLWYPPEPEDEEDERESTLFDDDDDDDATGEWGYLRSSNSFGSGEYRSRDRSCEEHKKAMKTVVDGHFRALIAQLLQVENLPIGGEDNKNNWLEIITSLSWEAAMHTKPDTSKGGGMDPGGYVKVKCIASGRRCDSMVVKGVVCKKNVAHRRMSSKIIKPRFLILGGALEYQRVTNVLSSVDTLLQQEMDHLKMAVAKIDAHHPNVLLVEKSVSRFAQDYLLAKNISLVLNIKRPLLERIARCTGAQIVPSIDHLSSQKLGYCDFFHVEKYTEEHGSAGQAGKKVIKTLMFFEGCPRPLGCTILLKGANVDELKKVKHVIQYGVFAAYHLALETSFLADEGASLPELPLKSPITVALPDKPSSIDRSISTIPGFSNQVCDKQQASTTSNVPRPNKSDPMLTTVNIKDMQLAESSLNAPERVDAEVPLSAFACPCGDINGFSVEKNKPTKELDTRGFVEHLEAKSVINNAQTVEGNSGFIDIRADDKQILGRQPVLSNLERIPHQENNRQDAYELPTEEFSTSDHQSILVSLSSRCIWKGTVCERSHLFRIKYYGSFDKPLGRFLRDNLFDQGYRCRSCDLPPEAHVHCYTHRQGSLTISVRQQDLRLSGERDGKIWMWHRCLKCPRINCFPPATRRVVMSDAAWGLSFGKFLELSFSNNAAASRVASCGHSLHRDCLRFYGFGKMVACFRYAPIKVYSVYLPPSKLDFNYHHQEWIQKEADEVVKRAKLLYTEIMNKLHQIAESRLKTGSNNDNSVALESSCIISNLEEILHKEKAEFEESLQKAMNKEVKGQKIIDILEINKLRRQLLFWSYYWDQRLICVANFDYNRARDRSRDKISSTNKLADLNISPKPRKPHLSLDALPSRIDEPLKEERDVGEDSFQRNQSKPSSINSSEQLDTQDYSVRRVHSEGQFPVITDLSDTLDAKWAGENGPTTFSETGIPNTSTTTEVASVSSGPILKSGNDVSKPLPSAVQNRLGNSEEGFPSWIEVPFLNFYRAMNNDGNAQKVEALNEYNPVYISLFRDLESQGGARLLLPVGVDETVIPVYDDEPTSIISYALISSNYHSQLSDERDRLKESRDSSVLLVPHDSGKLYPLQSVDETSSESLKSIGTTDVSLLSMSGSKSSLILDPLAYTKALHIRISFSGDGSLGKVKYTVTCYYAKHFDSLRRTCCPTEVDFIRSLSRCKQWGAQGGKSNVFFAKSLDDRFIIKQVTKTELESFIKFAPEYFKYLSESISTGCPTCLAKILGIYQITTKHVKGGKESKIDVLVMENLLFGRNVTRLYDLKGSARSRYNPDSSGKNKVLLDQNLIEAMPTSPIFVGNKAKRVLERAVWNDTAFLASVDVMDYSLLVGVDEEKHELVLGIIDFMRQYTWDKHLETWVKASGILGGSKNEAPTVISPKQYKKRFRKAMSAYFLVVPDQWSPSSIIPSNSQSEVSEDVQLASRKL